MKEESPENYAFFLPFAKAGVRRMTVIWDILSWCGSGVDFKSLLERRMDSGLGSILHGSIGETLWLRNSLRIMIHQEFCG